MRESEVIFNTLKKHPLSNGLTDEHLSYISSVAQIHSYKKREYIFFEEEPTYGLFIVISGILSIYKETNDGRTLMVDIVPAGSDVVCLSTADNSQHFTLRCFSEASVVFINENQLYDVSLKFPVFGINLYKRMYSLVLRTYRKLKVLSLGNAEEKIAFILLSIADALGEKNGNDIYINSKITRQEIAEMAGTTVETAIRVISRWTKNKVVESFRDQIVIRNKKFLEKYLL